MIRRKTSKTMWSAVRPLGLFAVAVLALSAGVPLTVHSAEKKAATEESDAKMAGLVDPLLKDAIALYKANKYEQALAKCKEIDSVFARTKHLPSAQVTAQKSMISQLRSEVLAKWGKVQMLKVRGIYDEADRLFKKEAEVKAANKDFNSIERKAVALMNQVIAETGMIITRNPGVATQARALQQAARKYLDDKAAWSVKNDKAIAARENFIKEKIDPLYIQSAALLKDNLYKRSYGKLMEAAKLLDDQKFSHSAKVLEVKSRLLALKEEIVRKWEIAYIMEARKNYLMAMEIAPKDVKKAVEYAKRAQNTAVEGKSEIPSKNPSKDLQNIEEACARFFKSADFIQLSALPADEVSKIKMSREEIDSLLTKGEALFRRKLYSEARTVFEKVYTLDPFNERANIMLSKIYRKINDTAWLRRENEILERINEVEWKWILPSRERHVDQLDDTPLPDDRTSEKATIYKKLQDIIYPGADFEDENVTDVFSQILRRSRELDPEKKGVPIFFPAFKEDKFVTLKVGQMPIGELLRYVCMYSGLKYKVTPLGVEIGGNDLDDMREQTFTMSSSLYKNITGAGLGETKSLLAEDSGNSDDLFGDDDKKSNDKTSETATSSAVDNDALKMFFVECGVPFGDGSAISYNDNVNKLTVRNTPENLKTMAMLLEKIDIETELVLVEAKIIEISVTDLEELGFDWTLTHNNTDPKFLIGNAVKEDSAFGTSGTFGLGEAVVNQVLVRHAGGGGSSGNLSTEDVTSALNLINSLNILPNFGKDGAFNAFLTVHAVDQSSRGEVIAAPKVLAKSGTAASIQMVQQMYFPTEWETEEPTIENNTYQYTPPVPEMGDAEPIGTEFTVTPEVETNLRTITLTLNPKITALVGWTDYSYEYIVGNIRSGTSTDTQSFPASMRMPEISERSLTTKLKIYDGDTVVLGGVLQENAAKRDDKYPFLGEIPLIGSLFSSKASRSIKQNLLIFVTPRLIRYDGVPVNPVNDNGRFDFNR